MKSILIYLLRTLFFVEGAATWMSEKVWDGMGRAGHVTRVSPYQPQHLYMKLLESFKMFCKI
jgi:hypothetical protein